MSAPRIAVSPSRKKKDAPDVHYIGDNILRAVESCGGEPVMIDYPLDERALAETLPSLSALLLPGGMDVHPRYYGQEIHPHCGEICEERDELELRLMQWALAEKKPILAICRGVQVLNVALGGTLYQDLPSQTGLMHRQTDDLLYFHDVTFAPDSLLSRLIGSEHYPVNSYHHQAILDVAEGLKVTARSPQGIIEAVEGCGDQFILGLQWHPESSFTDDLLSRRIFEAFIKEALI